MGDLEPQHDRQVMKKNILLIRTAETGRQMATIN